MSNLKRNDIMNSSIQSINDKDKWLKQIKNVEDKFENEKVYAQYSHKEPCISKMKFILFDQFLDIFN